MEIEKIELSDNEMENLPLFFKTIYHNLLIDPNFEEKLMMYNPETKFKAIPQRTLPLFYNCEKINKDGQVL